jgi:hypothetical protein
MSASKQRRLEHAVASIQQRYGAQALVRGGDLGERASPHIATGFAALDAITGCGGVPLGAITLLSGRSTSGKLTLAYKLLANAQRTANRVQHTVGLLDLSRTADPDYVHRCGVELDYLLVGRPVTERQAVELLGDLAQRPGVRALVVDSLADLTETEGLRRLHALLPHLQQMVRCNGCAVILLDEAHAPWRRWLNLDSSQRVRQAAALHIEMQREQWLRRGGDLVGYRAQAHVCKSRWVQGGRRAIVEIVFNGTVKARETW